MMSMKFENDEQAKAWARGVAVIHLLKEVARPLILQEYRADSCIVSTRLGIDALEHFNVPAEPVSYTMLAFNGAAMKLLEAGRTLEQVKAISEQYRPGEPGGPWSVAVGAPGGPGYAGHVSIALPAYELLLDLSFDQLSRPLKRMKITGPELFPLEKGWLGEASEDDKKIMSFDGKSDEGDRLYLSFIRPAHDPDGYLKSPDWNRTGRRPDSKWVYRRTLANIISAIQARIQEAEEAQ